LQKWVRLFFSLHWFSLVEGFGKFPVANQQLFRWLIKLFYGCKFFKERRQSCATYYLCWF